ncbi:MAG: serine/threonine-protein kinase, partial [Chloroflexota bacterium]
MHQQLGHYRVEELLGEGTFAQVYRAFDEKRERYIALKILKAPWLGDTGALARFKQEGETMAMLKHPNLISVYEVGEARGQVYLAEFLVEGETLSERLSSQGPLSWSETIDILRPIASALDYLHSQNSVIVHRDIKPSNILLSWDEEIYLGDFGSIRYAEGSAVINTSKGQRIGTVPYMSPEQWEGQKVVPATDIYALGCIIVEMLTGQRLFDGKTEPALMKQHIIDGPVFPQVWPDDVPSGIEEVLQAALAQKPSERIDRASDLLTKLIRLDKVITAQEQVEEFKQAKAEVNQLSIEEASQWATGNQKHHQVEVEGEQHLYLEKQDKFHQPLVWGMALIAIVFVGVLCFIAGV